ncbi:VIT1/CCC1 transporter family protein [Bartonella ancashensis]|uniref:Putative transmembrane iron-regulated protein n=1 Tax=Bartonella ancashensis TaxID=1318743 RepID=A0A0M4L7E2_9HYPH|nr:hypothetical protein [Bartonella ancashensis]ALE03100.1 putative transmembrane iron-regulated protein [Bartonella ancashensis]
MLKAFFSFFKNKTFVASEVSHNLAMKENYAGFCGYGSKMLPLPCPLQTILSTEPSSTAFPKNSHKKECPCHSCNNYVKITNPTFQEASSFSASQASTITANKPLQGISFEAYRQKILTWIQPGLAGLMDGSVSTLAPIFAAAFATGDTYKTFLIGLSASIGAGLSMGFTEAVHDDGKLSGRGSPLKRGLACGIMTTIGGLGHTLPYLLHSFYAATILAIAIVFFELWAIVWIQNKFMATPLWRASLQVIVGGVLVFMTGILIGSI